MSTGEIADTHEGDGLIRISWISTLILSAACYIAGQSAEREVVLVIVSLSMLALGSVVFASAFLHAVSARREDLIGIGGLFFLAGSAPTRVKLNLMGSLAVQVVVTLGTAALRPYTALAFAVLAPMFGLGIAGMWGARHGTFPPRTSETSNEHESG